MFGYRTPAKVPQGTQELDSQEEGSPERNATSRVGPSKTQVEKESHTTVKECLRGMGVEINMESQSSPVKEATAGPSRLKLKESHAQVSKTGSVKQKKSTEVAGSSPGLETVKPKGRIMEAKACLIKAKLQINSSRNLKAEIKTEVVQAVERLYQLVKEAETAGHNDEKEKGKESVKKQIANNEIKKLNISTKENEMDLVTKIEEHGKLLQENMEEMRKLKNHIQEQKEWQEKTATYANVVAGETKRRPTEQTALHSVVVTSKDEKETGEEVLNRIRKAINAKDGGVNVDKVRKAKDRKVIVGCSTAEDRGKVTERLRRAGDHLIVEEIKNKDPLVILKDVLQYNTNEDVLGALRNQNGSIFKDLEKEDNRVEVRFRKKTRNPHTCHIIMRVSPKIWQKMTMAETVHIDLQRIRVADYSPLIQCSTCLGYGHSKRFCKETIEKCSHCGGPHMKMECADWLSGAAPSCCNCTNAKLEMIDHNAFSQDCAVRKKWEAIARATIAYC